MARFTQKTKKPLRPIPNGSSNHLSQSDSHHKPINCGRDGSVVEYKQDPVDESRYREQLEEELLFTSPNEPESVPTPDPFAVDESTVRYWSDYNRVDYHPRSIQRLPDLPDWDLGMGDWVAGKETFDKYNNQVSCYPDCAVVTSYSSI